MTRPQKAAERFVSLLPGEIRAGLSVVYSPLIGIEPTASEINFGDARGLIFTSANAVEVTAALSHHRGLPSFCVGQATTRAAIAAGWTGQYSGENSEALIKTLHQSRPMGPLLHIRGTHSRGNVALRLSASGCPTREQVVYDQPLLSFSDIAEKSLTRPAPIVVPLFSPRTARQFANLVTGSENLHFAALSDAVAEQVKPLKFNQLKVSKAPNARSMAQLVSQMINDAIWVEGGKPAQ